MRLTALVRSSANWSIRSLLLLLLVGISIAKFQNPSELRGEWSSPNGLHYLSTLLAVNEDSLEFSVEGKKGETSKLGVGPINENSPDDEALELTFKSSVSFPGSNQAVNLVIGCTLHNRTRNTLECHSQTENYDYDGDFELERR